MDRARFDAAARRLEARVAEAVDALSGLPHLKVDALALRGQVRRFTDSAGLGLVIAGGEGVGKSRLANGLLGTRVTPEHGARAGTVAPVVLEYAATREPRYTVWFLDGSSRQMDAETFRQHLLQVHNDGNRHEVARGVVGLDSDLLKGGLVLTDMPGARGADFGLRAQIEGLFEDAAFSVLGVCADREYGPLLDVIRMARLRPHQLAGVVNTVSDLFFPDTEAAAERQLTQRRAALVEVFAQRGFALDPGRVFIVHLPSLSALTRGERPSVRHACHGREVDGLRAHLAGLGAAFDFSGPLEDAKQRALTLLDPLAEELARRERLFAGLRAWWGGGRQAAFADCDNAETGARDVWAAVPTHDLAGAVMDRAVAGLAQAVEAYRVAAALEERRSLALLEGASWFDDDAMERLVEDFSLRLVGKYGIFRQAYDLVLEALVRGLIDVSGAVLSDYEARVPVTDGSLRAPLAVDAEEVVGRGGWPLAVGAPPRPVIDTDFFNRREPRQRAVRRVHAAVAGIDLSDGGAPRQRLQAALVALHAGLTPAFEAALERNRTLLERGSREQDRLNTRTTKAARDFRESLQAIAALR